MRIDEMNHNFCSELLKRPLLRQRSFQKANEKEWNFQKTVFLAWCDEKILHLKWVFTHAQTIASTVELSFDVPTVFLDRDSRENVVFGKLHAFGQSESNVKFFSRTVFGLLHQMLSRKMQNHLLCGRTTCSENIFLCRAIKAYLFSNVVSILGIRCSVGSWKVKPSFSNWISEGTTFLES